MIFNSLTFLIFLAVTLAFYYKLTFKAQNVFLLMMSYDKPAQERFTRFASVY